KRRGASALMPQRGGSRHEMGVAASSGQLSAILSFAFARFRSLSLAFVRSGAPEPPASPAPGEAEEQSEPHQRGRARTRRAPRANAAPGTVVGRRGFGVALDPQGGLMVAPLHGDRGAGSAIALAILRRAVASSDRPRSESSIGADVPGAGG